MTLTAYKNTSDPRTVTKSIVSIGTYSSIKIIPGGSNSITSLNISLRIPDFQTFNYAYIPELKRYYFVSDITFVSGVEFILNMHCDVLMSFKSELMSCQGMVERQEFLSDRYMYDPYVNIGNNVTKTLTLFPNPLPYDGSENLFVNIAGGLTPITGG